MSGCHVQEEEQGRGKQSQRFYHQLYILLFGIKSMGSKGKRLPGKEIISYKISIKNAQEY